MRDWAEARVGDPVQHVQVMLTLSFRGMMKPLLTRPERIVELLYRAGWRIEDVHQCARGSQLQRSSSGPASARKRMRSPSLGTHPVACRRARPVGAAMQAAIQAARPKAYLS